MSVLNKIARFQNRRDQAPNKALAKELAETADRKGIREIAENLWNENRQIQSDCLSVLEEIGARNPELIADYAGDLLKLAQSRESRLVWASMISLARIAHLRADEIYAHHEAILRVMKQGSVIAADNAVKILAVVASRKDAYRASLLPHLLKHLETCRSKDVPQHAESTVAAINAVNKEEFIKVLEKRIPDMSSPQAARLRKVIREAEKC